MSTGGATGAGGLGGGSAKTGGATGAGSATNAGGATASGGNANAGGIIAAGGSPAGGGITGTGGSAVGGSTGCAPGWTMCCGQCLSPLAGVCAPCSASDASQAGGALGIGGMGAGGSGDAPDANRFSETALPAQCANQVLDSLTIPVHGTVRGPKVDAEVCDNGLGTSFLGPQDTSPQDTSLAPYAQGYSTTTAITGDVLAGSDGPGVYGFLLRAPADALFANLSGWTGASASAAGTYDSTTNCGWLDFDVTLPVPPDVVCTTQFGPCDPGCTGVGEMAVCEPANAMLHYQARPSATCQTNQDPPVGDWQLTITSVSPLAISNGYQHFQTHGHLTATLVNQADASDSVALNLDF
jgi:hypothetical protein